jgi:hypothetical protein
MIHDLTASPYFRVIRRPPATQPVAVPLSPIDRQALDFWQASLDVRSERRTLHSVLFGKRKAAEDKLHRLNANGFLYGIRNRARHALVDCGAAPAFTAPRGPFGGSVA